MGGQAKCLSGGSRIVHLPSVALGGGEGTVPLVAAAAFDDGDGDDHGGFVHDFSVAGEDGGAFGQGSLLLAFHCDIAHNLGMLPAGGVGRRLDYLRQQLMGDGLVRELADASAASDTFVCSHL